MSTQYIFKSPLGPISLVASEKGLQGVYLDKQKNIPSVRDLQGSDKSVRQLKKVALQLTEYFAGRRKQFSLDFDIQGTDFQRKVWNELSRIPYGQVCSYSDIAKKIKNPKAVRAVGSANGKNPLCIIVPCHRVIAADGTLGGYSGGLKVKSQLLKLEKVSL
jgi:methylated-DNA-[protein]-cysteine S-methyltransferase